VTEPLTGGAPGALGLRAPAGGMRLATVRSVTHPNPHAVILRVEVPDRVDHLPGQHYTIRLTAEDGYVAQRSYSLASPASDPLLEFYIERLEDGEVSMFLADVVQPGDQLEIRGPIGGWFVWTGDSHALGVAGGSGVVPLVSMLRHAAHIGQESLLRLAVSARTQADLPYADELEAAGALIVLTREDSAAGRPRGRLAAAELRPLVNAEATCYVCGSNSFAEAASMLLVDEGVPAQSVRIERFGPSG
jgi:ferredoxin-NADP reductase